MAMVAQRAGVSTMTVSNVINGRQTTAEPTRQLVLEAIRELGYRPNAAAQALASAIQPHIGLLYHNAQNGFVSALLIGALAAPRSSVSSSRPSPSSGANSPPSATISTS
jgi:LacI family transcriptional regulator